jgi:23S rRNA (cytosine1962-C5)-methyltransferase
MKNGRKNNINFVALLETAIEKRRTLNTITNAMRLVNSYGDNLPGICVDRYNNHFVIHLFSEAGKSMITGVVGYITDRFDPEYCILKHRQISAGKEFNTAYKEIVVDKKGSQTVVSEYGLCFHVDCNDTLNTGLFLDMRRNRKLIAGFSAGKDVLNCFAYTGSFGVHCRAAGASRVVNVDISAKILDRGKNNYSLNALSYIGTDFVHTDSLRYLKRARKRENRFDCIIIDPPTFSRHKGEVFSIIRQLPNLLSGAFGIIKPGGNILIATNCSQINPDYLKKQIVWSALKEKIPVKGLLQLGQDIDFPGSGSMKESFLSCFCVSVKD